MIDNSKSGNTKTVQGEVVSNFGRPRKFETVDQLDEGIESYFKECDITRNVPTITGLAVFLDTDRRTLLNYKKRDEFFPSIKRALTRCEAAIEARAMLGGLNPAMAIFSLKNNYGWVDKQEVDTKHEVVTPLMTLEEHNAVSGNDSDQED